MNSSRVDQEKKASKSNGHVERARGGEERGEPKRDESTVNRRRHACGPSCRFLEHVRPRDEWLDPGNEEGPSR